MWGRDALSQGAGGALAAKAGSKLVCDLDRLCKKSPTGVFSFLHQRGAFFLFDKAEKKEWGSQKRRALEQHEVWSSMGPPRSHEGEPSTSYPLPKTPRIVYDTPGQEA